MEVSVHVNPVEIIKKDIYLLTNDINHMVYVGQALNAEKRFKEHCKPASAKQNSLIDRAIQKYGKEHFCLTVLESQVENYNDREIFWIMKYNCVSPNGYNITTGGENPPIRYGDDHPNTKLSEEKLKELQTALIETDESLRALAKRFGISKKQVLRINQGTSRVDKSLHYPLRKEPNTSFKLTVQQVEQIIHELMYTYKFTGEIAREFNVSVHLIDYINAGTSYPMPGVSYPIRDWKSCGKILLTYEQVTEIIHRLKTDTISINKLAKEYKVNANTIYTINAGTSKKFKRNTESYPIRPF